MTNEIKLECLRLAHKDSGTIDQVIERAEAYARFIDQPIKSKIDLAPEEKTVPD